MATKDLPPGEFLSRAQALTPRPPPPLSFAASLRGVFLYNNTWKSTAVFSILHCSYIRAADPGVFTGTEFSSD